MPRSPEETVSGRFFTNTRDAKLAQLAYGGYLLKINIDSEDIYVVCTSYQAVTIWNRTFSHLNALLHNSEI